DRAAAATLRTACAFPSREALLAGPIASAPIFRSAGSGATWARQIDPPLSLVLDLREQIDRFFWQSQVQVRPQADSGRGAAGGSRGAGAARAGGPVGASPPRDRSGA